jgi:membrane protein required for colicin V production
MTAFFLQVNTQAPMTFNAIDIFIFVILGLGAFRGYNKGFMVEFLSNFAFIIAIFLTFKGLEMGFQQLLADYLGGSKAAPFISFILMFLVIGFFINWLGRTLSKSIKQTFFEGVDNLLGLVLGLFRYVVALSILFKLIQYVGLEEVLNIKQTYFYSNFINFFDFIVAVFSKFMPSLGDTIKSIEQMLGGVK